MGSWSGVRFQGLSSFPKSDDIDPSAVTASRSSEFPIQTTGLVERGGIAVEPVAAMVARSKTKRLATHTGEVWVSEEL